MSRWLVGTGPMARCVQHETDHLTGMFIDRLIRSAVGSDAQIRQADWYDPALPPTIMSAPTPADQPEG